MNKELFKKTFEESQIVKDIRDQKIEFESGLTIEIKDYHERDCCENVYADWSDAGYVLPHLIGKNVREFVVKGVEGEGFLLCFNHDWETGAKVFIPCYNSQNGYYSSNLELKITIEGVETKIDISNFLEDDIN